MEPLGVDVQPLPNDYILVFGLNSWNMFIPMTGLQILRTITPMRPRYPTVDIPKTELLYSGPCVSSLTNKPLRKVLQKGLSITAF